MFFSWENGTYAHSIILIIKVIDFSIIKQSKKKRNCCDINISTTYLILNSTFLFSWIRCILYYKLKSVDFLSLAK